MLLCLPQFGDRDGQGGEVRGERHGDQRGVTGQLTGHGHQPGGGAKLAPCAGGMRYPAIAGAGGSVVAVSGTPQVRAAQCLRRDVQDVGCCPGRVGSGGRIAVRRVPDLLRSQHWPDGPRARRSRSVPGQ